MNITEKQTQEAFIGYLLGKKISFGYAQRYIRCLEHAQSHLHRLDSSTETSDLWGYIEVLRQEGKKPRTINSYLKCVRMFFSWLMGLGLRKTNPAAYLYVRGELKKEVAHTIGYADLLTLLDSYPGNVEQRALLSLMVHQGLKTEELRALEIGFFDWEKGVLLVPSVGKGLSRRLSLNSGQVFLLLRFLDGRSKGSFFVYDSVFQFRNRIGWLMERLKRHLPGLENVRQIRSIVLNHWLQSEDLRIVQYKAGHRYVVSTERHSSNDLLQLQKTVDHFHPFA